MNTLALWLIAIPVFLGLYTYIGYPLVLRLLPRRAAPGVPLPSDEWPDISITLPAYNEERQIRSTIEALVRLDYPRDRRQIVVVSDASTDRTDEIVREYEPYGVELVRLERRGGKGAAERAAAPVLRGEIIVNTDASIRIGKDSLKPLIRQFRNPSVGLASGRDISVASLDDDVNAGESSYVGYEMGIRRLETAAGGIVGASGCFYAIRSNLHRVPLPESLSRDFASVLICRDHGYTAVSVDEATCLVARTGSLRREYARKVRTMTRGMRTLWHMRHLLNPVRFGSFAWKLASHKVCRWLLPWAGAMAAVGLILALDAAPWALPLLVLTTVIFVLAAWGWLLGNRPHLPRFISIPAFLVSGNVAAIHAFVEAVRGRDRAIWEPTQRDTPSEASIPAGAAAR